MNVRVQISLHLPGTRHSNSVAQGLVASLFPRSAENERRFLSNGRVGQGHRVSDERICPVVARSEVIEFSYPRGTVPLIESLGSIHFSSFRNGSRRRVARRVCRSNTRGLRVLR